MDFLKTRNGKIIAVIAVVAIIGLGYYLYKRSKSEGWSVSTPLYGDASGNPNYDDFGLIGPSGGGDMYAPLGYDNRDGTAANITRADYYNY
jgi:hypothetical protein